MHGDRGSAVIDDDVLTFLHRTPEGAEREEKLMGSFKNSPNEVAADGAAGAPSASSNPRGLGVDAHRRQYENFLAALDGTEPVRVDLETNRQAIGIITGAYESARTHAPVSLA